MKKKKIMKNLNWILDLLKRTPEEYVDSWNSCHDSVQSKLQYDDYFPFILGIVESEIKWIVKELENERIEESS